MVGGQPALRRGEALWQLLARNLAARGITVRHEHAATGLTVAGDGRVIGAVAGGEPLTATRGVILACGGFEADEYFKDAFLPVARLHRVGHDGNTGDAVRMTLQAGGALWHMSEFFGWYAFKAAEYDAAFPVDFHGPGFVLVNAIGQRFGDETGYEVHERLRALVNVKPAAAGSRGPEARTTSPDGWTWTRPSSPRRSPSSTRPPRRLLLSCRT